EGDGLSALWGPRFPTPEMLSAAAAMYPGRAPWAGEEGPRHRIAIAPGVLALERPDLARLERRIERQTEHRARLIDQRAIYLAEHGEPSPPGRGRHITSWSAKSRGRMTRRLAELDWTPLTSSGRLPAMVTLTYPGDWLPVAPDAAAMMAHIKA